MSPLQGQLGNSLNWIIHRNPAYLISAVLMAVGARLLLVDPNDPAGDVRLIVITLAALQVYEWAVGAILIALHRSKRSPEDKPSLMLVAAVFWTGPFAATLEMIALRPSIGTYVAIGACVLALGELQMFSRVLGVRMSVSARAVAGACIVLLACAAPLLKTPDSDSGVNELYLYAAWWGFAGILLGCIGAIRSHRRRSAADGHTAFAPVAAIEFSFLTITALATAVHLVGMNYGFFCHASYFYASPVIVAVSIVAFEFLVTRIREKPWLLFAPFTFPAIAIVLALQPFDPAVPVNELPDWARDPLAGVSVIAALAWWFGFVRLGNAILLHAGNAACVVVALALTKGNGIVVAQLGLPHHQLALYGLAAYLAIMALLRRSRAEAVLALVIQLLATALAVEGRTPADTLIICIVGGWSGLAGIHLVYRQPSLRLRLQPIAILAIVPWMLESAPVYRLEIAIHSALLMVALFAIGQAWRWTRYRLVAGVLATGHLACAAGYAAMQSAHPAAAMLVSIGFVLLIAGALVSWHKEALLRWMPVVIVERQQAGATGVGDTEQSSFDVENPS